MQQHDVDDTKTRKSDYSKACTPNTPGAREAEDIQQLTPTLENNTQGQGEQRHISHKATQRFHEDTLQQLYTK